MQQKISGIQQKTSGIQQKTSGTRNNHNLDPNLKP